MENEMEIFRAWLKKIVKTDKTIKGKVLAKSLGIPATRISYYHSGRIDNGTRTYPAIPFEIREKILEITNTPYKEMIETGREELIIQTNPGNLNKQLEGLLDAKFGEYIESKGMLPATQSNDLKEHTHKKNKEHHDLIDEFEDPETALSINQKIRAIEKLDPASFKEIDEDLDLRLTRALKKITEAGKGKLLGDEKKDKMG